jgi:AmmeMemoRadiSam system protein A
MPSSDPPEYTPLSSALRQELLGVAQASIEQGLTEGHPLHVHLDEYGPELQQERACFVTLHLRGSLRGCIGHLEAVQPLIKDVADNAYAAAFRDPRFPPVERKEVEGLEIHISILTPAHPMTFSSETELLSQLRPGIDGLILEEGARRGTFLPSVWESLPDSTSFLQQLKVKAGLSPGYWSNAIKVYRYQTESF